MRAVSLVVSLVSLNIARFVVQPVTCTGDSVGRLDRADHVSGQHCLW